MATTLTMNSHEVTQYSRRYEGAIALPVSAERAFAHLDDQRQLGSHMSESSWQMGGGRMQIDFDAGKGQVVGSVITLSGRVLGLNLIVSEAVTERAPPHRKVWETFGTPHLLIIGAYRMGFELSPDGAGCQLRVFIEYALPRGPARLLGWLLARPYAKWCTHRMLIDAERHFAIPGTQRDVQ